MTTLESLKLSGWKSIKETDPPITFDRLNVLVGANGAGKSNLVSFFRLLSEMMAGRLQQFVREHDGPDVLLHRGIKRTDLLEAKSTFRVSAGRVDYEFTLRPTALANTLTISTERIQFPATTRSGKEDWTGDNGLESILPGLKHHPPGEVIVPEVVDLMANSPGYHFHDTSPAAAVRQPGYVNDNRRLRSDAGNLAAMLYLYKQTRPPVYRRILGAIKQVAPFVHDLELEPLRLKPTHNQLDWLGVGSSYLLRPHQLSDGTLRMIALATLLLQPESDLPPLIVLDEPELGLHPAALGILAGLLKQAAVHAQVLVATQSATLLNHFEPQDVIVVDAQDGVSTFRRLDPEPYREWIAEYGLSDLWERNVIGGGPY